jgi:hypothetical protein
MSKIFKMIYRDELNPETHKLHIFEVFTRVEKKQDAVEMFNTKGPHFHVVAGPMGPIDESDVPVDATWLTND